MLASSWCACIGSLSHHILYNHWVEVDNAIKSSCSIELKSLRRMVCVVQPVAAYTTNAGVFVLPRNLFLEALSQYIKFFTTTQYLCNFSGKLWYSVLCYYVPVFMPTSSLLSIIANSSKVCVFTSIVFLSITIMLVIQPVALSLSLCSSVCGSEFFFKLACHCRRAVRQV